MREAVERLHEFHRILPRRLAHVAEEVDHEVAVGVFDDVSDVVESIHVSIEQVFELTELPGKCWR